MKIARIEAEFAELKGNNIAVGHGQGSTVKAAIARAIGDLLKQPNVKRKHITTFKASVTFSNKTENPE